jgi:prolyl 4-hydroxylase
MNAVFVLSIVSVAIIVASMTYLVWTIHATRRGIADHFSDLFSNKASSPGYSVEEIDGFLSPQECDHLIQISKNRLEDSMVYSDSSDVHDRATRISKQAWLRDEDDPVVMRISQKVASLSGYPIGNQEDLQVVCYRKGGYFRPHYDACDGDGSYCSRMDGRGGPRILTYLIYLNDDFEGGGTVFPKLNIAIKPKKGKCVVFRNTLPSPDNRIILEALHGGSPVASGNKWICNKWVRGGSYSSTNS